MATPSTTIEIFRAGTHTAASGKQLTFSAEDVAAIAAGYDPAKHEAPIVVGHPATDAPAWGWIGGLAMAGDTLVATPRQVAPEFAELVKAGRFRKVSASFYAPDAPNNPTPGQWHLRHVGFLGAQPPAVKGLRPVQFAADEAGVESFADGWALGSIARLFRGLREWIIGAQGQDQADAVLPGYMIDSLADEATRNQAPAGLPAFTDPPKPEPKEPPKVDPEKLAAEQAALETRATELAAREAAFAEQVRATRRAADAAFAEALVKQGRLPKALQKLATDVLAQADDATTADFADDKAVTHHAALQKLLSALPVPVAFGEFAPAGERGEPGATDLGARADAIFAEARSKGLTITHREAVRRAEKELAA